MPPRRNVEGPVRSSRQRLLSSLGAYSFDTWGELSDRLLLGTGVRMASPFLDQRVVRLALSLPAALRAPHPGPKPLLARAFLGPFDTTRRKTSFLAHYLALARASRQMFGDWFGPDALAARLGLVDGVMLGAEASDRWNGAVLRHVVLEAWLRSR